MRDLYETLGVTKTASADEIKQATASSPRSGTPTTTPATPSAEEKFKEITAAYDTLSDPEKRKAYDQFGAAGGVGAAAASTRPPSATSRASAASTCPTCSPTCSAASAAAARPAPPGRRPSAAPTCRPP